MTLADPTPSPPTPQPEAGPDQAGKPRLLRKLLRAETGIILLAVTPIVFLVLSLSGVINGTVRFKQITFPWDKPTKCDTFLAEITRDYGDYQPDVPYSDDNIRRLALYAIRQNNTLELIDLPEVSDEFKPYQKVNHQVIWDQYTAIIPPDNLPPVAFYEITTDGQQGNLASIYWDTDVTQYVLRIDIIDASNTILLTQVLLHEYSHRLTLNPEQIDMEQYKAADCSSPPFCMKADSYLTAFYEKFWADIYAEWEEGEGFYGKYRFDFVSRYAMTSPKEDIAETLTHFFLRTKPSYPEVVADKIQFFYHYRELVRLRKEIRQNICDYFEIGK